jgi:hypothetical protein
VGVLTTTNCIVTGSVWVTKQRKGGPHSAWGDREHLIECLLDDFILEVSLNVTIDVLERVVGPGYVELPKPKLQVQLRLRCSHLVWNL